MLWTFSIAILKFHFLKSNIFQLPLIYLLSNFQKNVFLIILIYALNIVLRFQKEAEPNENLMSGSTYNLQQGRPNAKPLEGRVQYVIRHMVWAKMNPLMKINRPAAKGKKTLWSGIQIGILHM